MTRTTITTNPTARSTRALALLVAAPLLAASATAGAADVAVPNGAPISVFVNNGHNPRAAIDSSGTIVVLWEQGSAYGSIEGEGGNYGTTIAAQYVDANGSLLGGPFHVNGYVHGGQGVPRVTATEDDEFLALWWGVDGNGLVGGAPHYMAMGTVGDYASERMVDLASEQNPQLMSILPTVFELDVDTSPLGHEAAVWSWNWGVHADINGTFVAVDSGPYSRTPDLAVNDLGTTAIVWQDHQGTDYEAVMSIYDPNGTLLVGPLSVYEQPSYDQKDPSVVTTADGGFLVAWADQETLGVGVCLRFFAADGTPTSERIVVTENHWINHANIELAADPWGRAVLAYTANQWGNYGHLIDTDLHEVGPAFSVGPSSAQLGVVMGPNDDFVVSYEVPEYTIDAAGYTVTNNYGRIQRYTIEEQL